MHGMDMDSGSSAPVSFAGIDACYLGQHNGSFPNGTLGGGTWQYGHYVPTMDEMMACQAGNDPWSASFKYGEWTTWFFVSFFLLAALLNGLKRFDVLSRNAAVPSTFALPPRLTALVRTLDQPRLSRFVPTLGVSLLTLAFTVFSFAICFGIYPYYRPPNFGSSPLGLRSEWIATALIVWIFATAMKRNVLACLTGLTFHRLMSLHKVLPWFCLFFSVVHTGAMIVRANAQQPWSVTWQTNSQYGWSAWAALASLFWLCALSLGPVRRLSHEFFYPMHVVAALLFLATCYLHFERLLGSWAYLHASVAVVGAAFLYRLGAVALFSRAFTRPDRATLEALGDGAVGISIEVKSGMRWSAGQHVFVRFLTLHPWSTHPFTIASLDPSSIPFATLSSPRTMRLVLRPHSGLTARLAALAASGSPRALPILLDGPYGPSSLPDVLHGADEALLLAGGTGISFVLPLLDALIRGAELHVVRKVRVVWAVPSEECLGWFAEEIERALRAFEEGRARVEKVDSRDSLAKPLSSSSALVVSGPTLRSVSVEVYVTRAGAAGASEEKKADSPLPTPALATSSLANAGVVIHSGGRPDVPSLVREAIQNAEGRLAVVSCGPPGLLTAARNTVARAQVAIAAGSLGGGIGEAKGAREVVLWEESFEL
ncbi:hypothetical protein JCM10450v2_001548 [Rhodotorula kratochvilovae]